MVNRMIQREVLKQSYLEYMHCNVRHYFGTDADFLFTHYNQIFTSFLFLMEWDEAYCTYVFDCLFRLAC